MKDINKYIGNKIRLRRKELGLTQENLATAMSLNRLSILNIEKGRHGTTAESMFTLCATLNCTPNDIFPPVKLKKLKYRWVEKTIRVPKKIKVKVLVK